MNVGKSIKVALASKGMTQKELAKRMGFTHTWVSALANRRKASMDTVEAMAAQFDMKVSEFVKLGED